MANLRRCLFSICSVFALLLSACGGGGGGSSSASIPALTDNGGVWVGNWTGTSGLGSGMKGLIAVELHQSAADLTGSATITNSLLSSDQPCSGTVNGSSIQFGVVGHVEYTGTLSGTSASGVFTDHDTSTSGTWTIRRYMDPFDGAAAPGTNGTGTWTAVSHSTISGTNLNSTLQVTQTDHDLQGSVDSIYPFLAGHVAGTKVWYAFAPGSDTLVVAYGDLSAISGDGGWVQFDAYVASNPEDQGTWTATKQP